MKTAEKMLKDALKRKADYVEQLTSTLKEWSQALERAQAELLNTANDPKALDQNAAAKEKVQTAMEKKAEAEQVLEAINNNQRTMVSDDESRDFERQIMREAVQQLLDICRKQIKLHEEFTALQKKAWEINQAAHASFETWNTQLAARPLYVSYIFNSLTSADGLRGNYGTFRELQAQIMPIPFDFTLDALQKKERDLQTHASMAETIDL